LELADVPLETRIEGLVRGAPGAADERLETGGTRRRGAVAEGSADPRAAPVYVRWRRRGATTTPQERAELVALRRAGLTADAISQQTGWTVEQVREWSQQPRATPEIRAEAMRLREAGMSFAQVAREVGYSKASVRSLLVPRAARGAAQSEPSGNL
jgi:hypothetical protein